MNGMARLRRRFIFMGILNAIFAPFIVLYLIMYSFFRYFEVSILYVFFRGHIDGLVHIGISQRPFIHWWTEIYVIRQVEVPRIQRATTFLHAAVRRELPHCEHLHRTIPKRKDISHHEVFRLCLIRLCSTDKRYLDSYPSSLELSPLFLSSPQSSTQISFSNSKSHLTELLRSTWLCLVVS